MLGLKPISAAPFSSLDISISNLLVSETISFSEQIIRTITLPLSEVLTFAEVGAGIKIGNLVVSEIITFIEKLPKVLDISESIGFNETITQINITKSPLVSETIVFSETLQAQKIVLETVSESFSLSETLRKIKDPLQIENINFQESISTIVLKTAIVSENIIFIENLSMLKPIKKVQDGLSLIETLTFRKLAGGKPTEQLSLIENISVRVLKPQVIVETFEFNEDLSLRNLSTTISESVVFGEILKINPIYNFSICESFSFSESPKRVINLIVSESITFAENSPRNSIFEALNFIETVLTNYIQADCDLVGGVPDKIISEQIKFNEVLGLKRTWKLNINETLTLDESSIYYE